MNPYNNGLIPKQWTLRQPSNSDFNSKALTMQNFWKTTHLFSKKTQNSFSQGTNKENQRNGCMKISIRKSSDDLQKIMKETESSQRKKSFKISLIEKKRVFQNTSLNQNPKIVVADSNQNILNDMNLSPTKTKIEVLSPPEDKIAVRNPVQTKIVQRFVSPMCFRPTNSISRKSNQASAQGAMCSAGLTLSVNKSTIKPDVLQQISGFDLQISGFQRIDSNQNTLNGFKAPSLPSINTFLKAPAEIADMPIKPKVNQKSSNAYSIEGQIGKGSYAIVYQAIDSASKKKYAVKVYSKEAMKSKTRREIVINEVKVLRILKHPNVLKLFRVRETKTEIHILTELIEGVSLAAFCKTFTNREVPENIAKGLASKILSGFQYLHSMGVFHRDIKLENILIDKENNPKIIDFGFSIQSISNSNLNLFCGTPNYMSPEIVQKKPYKGGPNDCWAFGVLLYKLLAGYFPFASKKTEELNKKIMGVELIFPSSIGQEARRVIEALLKAKPEDRASFDQISKFKFFL